MNTTSAAVLTAVTAAAATTAAARRGPGSSEAARNDRAMNSAKGPQPAIVQKVYRRSRCRSRTGGSKWLSTS